MFSWIKWRMREDSPRVHTSEPYATIEAAVMEACPLLVLHPRSLWIECANGKRIEADEIVCKCLGSGHIGYAHNTAQGEGG